MTQPHPHLALHPDALAGLPPVEFVPDLPTTGRIVRYVGKRGINAHRAAIVTMAADTWLREGECAPLSSDMHVHLFAFSPRTREAADLAAVQPDPGAPASAGFHEEDVPYDPSGAPGTWHWPPR